MADSYTAPIEIGRWDEGSFDGVEGQGKVTRAMVTKTYTGPIVGRSTTQTLMAYAEDGSASLVGMERIEATIDGRRGTLVLQHVGGYADGVATAAVTVIAGAGGGDFAGVSGDGDFRADPKPSLTLRLDG